MKWETSEAGMRSESTRSTDIQGWAVAERGTGIYGRCSVKLQLLKYLHLYINRESCWFFCCNYKVNLFKGNELTVPFHLSVKCFICIVLFITISSGELKSIQVIKGLPSYYKPLQSLHFLQKVFCRFLLCIAFWNVPWEDALQKTLSWVQCRLNLIWGDKNIVASGHVKVIYDCSD